MNFIKELFEKGKDNSKNKMTMMMKKKKKIPTTFYKRNHVPNYEQSSFAINKYSLPCPKKKYAAFNRVHNLCSLSI